MKVILAIVIASIPLLLTSGIIHFYGDREAKPKSENLYADCGVIMDDPGKIGDDVIVTMQNGNMFAFENEDGDWCIGNLVSILFDNNGTDIVYDDIIISYRYSGWISETEMENWVKC